MPNTIKPFWLDKEIKLTKDILCNDCNIRHRMAGAAMTTWYCNRCGEKNISGSTYTHLLCRHCACNGRVCQDCKKVVDMKKLPIELWVLTPDEWLETDEFKGITVLDPDGWDRKNFKEDWARKIKHCTMWEKVMLSTCSKKHD